jgi:hypothetical protein
MKNARAGIAWPVITASERYNRVELRTNLNLLEEEDGNGK